MVARRWGVPTCRRRRNAISMGWGRELRTCFTMRWRCCTPPAYREANAGARRMEWPRIPLRGVA